MDASTLHNAIAEVCPVISCTVVDAVNRVTWSYIAASEATSTQIAAANNVVATIPVDVLSTVLPSDLIARFTNAEYIALKTQQQADFAGIPPVIGNIKTWDTLMASASINMNSRSIKAIKNNLVSSGVLTQARADVIFS